MTLKVVEKPQTETVGLKDLFASIKEAISTAAKPEHFEMLIMASDRQIKKLEAEIVELRRVSLDPFTDQAAASEAKAKLGESEFELQRMRTARERLNKTLEQRERESRKADNAERYRKAKLERDALAYEITARYPDLAAQLADLFGRIVANDRLIAEVNKFGGVGEWLCSSEAMAREVPANFYTPAGWVSRITAIRLPDLSHPSPPIWAGRHD